MEWAHVTHEVDYSQPCGYNVNGKPTGVRMTQRAAMVYHHRTIMWSVTRHTHGVSIVSISLFAPAYYWWELWLSCYNFSTDLALIHWLNLPPSSFVCSLTLLVTWALVFQLMLWLLGGHPGQALYGGDTKVIEVKSSTRYFTKLVKITDMCVNSRNVLFDMRFT